MVGRGQGLKLAINAAQLQKQLADKTFKLAADVQKKSERTLNKELKRLDWFPPEGKEFVREWENALTSGREEFQGLVDKC